MPIGPTRTSQPERRSADTKTPRLTAWRPAAAAFTCTICSNGHVNQLYNVAGVGEPDITKVAKGPSGRAVWIASINVGNLQYVYYLATTDHVHELYYNDSTWLDEDLTVKAGVRWRQPPVLSRRWCFRRKCQRVFFIANNNHLWQMLSADNNVWASDDVTAKAEVQPRIRQRHRGFYHYAERRTTSVYLSKKHINQLSCPPAPMTGKTRI